MKVQNMIIGLVVVAVIGVVGVLVIGGHKGQKPPEPQSMKSVSLRLQWILDSTFVGDVAAEQKGYWKDAGLDVKVEPGGFEFNPIKLVAAGANTFGISNIPQILEARANGVPVVAIGNVIPRSPIGWVAKQSSGIKTPKDFIGKKVGDQLGTHTTATLDALLAKQGIQKAALSIVPMKFDPTPFIEGKVDVFPVYVTDQPYLLQSKGMKLNIIDPADYGVALYGGNVYITREDMLQKDPEAVREFLAGAYRGWQYAIEHNDEATAMLLAKNTQLDKAVTTEKVKAALAIMTKDSKDMTKVARFDPAKVEETKKMLMQYGGLKQVDATKVYTNTFIPETLPK